MKYQDVDVIVSRNWRYNYYGTNMYRVMRKLRCVKHDVKYWSKRYFGNFNDKLSKNSVKIDYMEERLIANPNSHKFNSWMQRLLKQREKMMLFNHKYCGKLARKE